MMINTILIVLLLHFASPQTKHLLLIGNMGHSKSTLSNELLNANVFKIGNELESCTSEVYFKKAMLFGDSNANIQVTVSDTYGLSDSYGRNNQFVDDIAAHLKSIEGVHSVTFMHNAYLFLPATAYRDF